MIEELKKNLQDAREKRAETLKAHNPRDASTIEADNTALSAVHEAELKLRTAEEAKEYHGEPCQSATTPTPTVSTSSEPIVEKLTRYDSKSNV